MATQGVDADRRVALARTSPFRLGSLDVIPALREIRQDQRREVLEPRVMQVLVLLAAAGGEIVGRDELLERCWDGRIVGDNAINRVISRLRRVGEDTGAFAIETVTKVGYRLVAVPVPGAASSDRSDPLASLPIGAPPAKGAGAIGRRSLLIAAGAAAVGVVAGGALWRGRAARDEAERLYELGANARRQMIRGPLLQAEAFFAQSVRADPGFARGWAALALSRALLLDNSADAELARLTRDAARAADRADRLEPRLAETRIARALLPTPYRRWQSAIEELRAALYGDEANWIGLTAMARLLANVGHWREAVTALSPIATRDAMLPSTRTQLGVSLWGAGRGEEADQLWRATLVDWPNHEQLWQYRFHFLALGGRAREALALLDDPQLPPLSFAPRTMLVACARGVGGDARARREAIATVREARARGEVWSLIAAIYLARLDATDEAIELTDRYFPDQLPPDGRRTPFLLFLPPGAEIVRHPRFAPIAERTGLARYWASAGGPEIVPI